MDKITERMVALFCQEYTLEAKKPHVQFEHFSAFSAIRRHYDRAFDVAEVIVGEGGDTGIDAIAIIVNNVLVTDVDTVEELAKQNGYIDASFIFVQAERSDHFDGGKISNLALGVADFFRDDPKLPRNEMVSEMASIAAMVYEKFGLFRKRPVCTCYYVTTAKWVGDEHLDARRKIAIDDIESTTMFSDVDFHCFGADEIQKAYNQTRNPVTREFFFYARTDIPSTPGIGQAFLGYIPYSSFTAIVSDASGKDIMGSIFEGNVRDGRTTRM